jgi:acetyltransferase-like isoleucine patch superfamily enzyme
MLMAFFRYKIHPTARIGYSLVVSERLEMGENSRIGHLTVCRGMNLIKLAESAVIGNLNWVVGLPIDDKSFYSDDPHRRSDLILDAHAAITSRQMIDCSNTIHVGRFSIVAGCGSQILTHSVDIERSRQASKPVRIGDYCFVGTGSILLPGSELPDYSILGAGSVLTKAYTEKYCLYGGVPARAVKALPSDLGYFLRKTGFVS